MARGVAVCCNETCCQWPDPLCGAGGFSGRNPRGGAVSTRGASPEMRFPISFIGLRHAGADEQVVAKGRRRVVAYLAFIVFVLMVAAASDEEWVEGGYEYTFSSTAPVSTAPGAGSCLGCDVPSAITAKLAAEPNLQATIHREFLLGLDKITIESQFAFWLTGEAVQQTCTFDLPPFIRVRSRRSRARTPAAAAAPAPVPDAAAPAPPPLAPSSSCCLLQEINAQAASNNTDPRNIWRGMAPISPATFASTLGLVGFAAFLQITVWLTMALVQYQAPFVSESLRALWFVRIVSIASVFFITVAVINFGAAPIRTEFCKAFDPDANFNGLPCGFG